MKMRKSDNDFVVDIEQNAMSSLSHGVEHFVDKETAENLKFAVIHVFHAVELFLKARLAKEHYLLIYTKPECSIDSDAHTVSFDAMIGRLNNIGLEFTRDELNDLKMLRRFRNTIEHHKIEANKNEVKNYIGRAARFLEDFIKSELDIILKDVIPEDIYKNLSEAIYSYEERLRKTLKEMDGNLPSCKKDMDSDYDIINCEVCGEETVVIPDGRYGENKTKCYFCNEEYIYEQCDRCGRHVLNMERGSVYCSDCWDDIISKD